MDLPKKDKNGISRLSYSQISTFINNKNEYYRRYIEKRPFITNQFIEFGSKVGYALERNDFSLFEKQEINVLKKVTRLDLFEEFTVLEMDGFNVYGYIDTCSNDFKKIIDYKTGKIGNENKYMSDSYIQLQIYALSIMQQKNVLVDKASVEFITREGNPFRKEHLKVSKEDIKVVNVDVSEVKLIETKILIQKIASEIESFYLKNRPC